jgi:hypothetical protein
MSSGSEIPAYASTSVLITEVMCARPTRDAVWYSRVAHSDGLAWASWSLAQGSKPSACCRKPTSRRTYGARWIASPAPSAPTGPRRGER